MSLMSSRIELDFSPCPLSCTMIYPDKGTNKTVESYTHPTTENSTGGNTNASMWNL